MIAFAFCLLTVSLSSKANTRFLVRGIFSSQEDNTNFQAFGSNHQRFNDDGIHLAHALLSTENLITDSISFTGAFNAYSDGEKRISFSQLYLKYRPLTAASIKPEVKLGAFYPAISAENTDFGWLSPHFLTNSAINSWIGEELRIGGIEFSLRQSGRRVGSHWSWKVLGSVYKGNDTIGSLLSWRGFALHDRQSLYNDRINFIPIPGVVDEDTLNAPAWTEPFREVDGRLGYYVGAHIAYKRSAEMRYYYYDNNADTNAIDPDRIYAWHTRFHSITLRYMYNPIFTVFSQLLVGDTLMGESTVDNDFNSGFIAAVYIMTPYMLAARADWYQVNDYDNYALDPNGSSGRAFTISAGRNISEHFSLTAEWQINSGTQQNLRFFQDNEHFNEHLFQLALTATF
ncbi:hypothetical protein BM527_17260 [Alteromonas sp. Mex14]|nr:hypothetical protein BM527_17260 [Alteromonas sp. Mex14]